MQLIDGYNGGVAHISASMIRDHNISLYGTGDCVLNVGNKFSYEIVNNNLIRINDGMAIIGGARTIVEYGQQETATIENGVSGYKRNDLIVIEYNKDNETLKETTELKVIKGTLGTEGADPALVTGDIRSGATQRQMALYRVRINGLSIEGVDKLWTDALVETKTLLWENASPTSEFTAQTVSIDLSDYDAVEVVFQGSTYQQIYCAIGEKGEAQAVWNVETTSNMSAVSRKFTVNANGVEFTKAVFKSFSALTTVNTNNKYMIPLKIYGIKGV